MLYSKIDAFVKSYFKLSFHDSSDTAFDTLLCCRCLEHPVWYDHGIGCTFEDLLREVCGINSGKIQLVGSKAEAMAVEMLNLRKVALDLLVKLV